MIICICKNISDKQIIESIKNENLSLEDLQIDLGVCIQCESCKIQIEDLLHETINIIRS